MPELPPFASQFEFAPDNSVVVITLMGKMDTEAVEELHPQIQEVFRAGVRRFVFDLKHLEYASSLGLRLLVGLANQVKGEGAVAMCNPVGAVRSVLEMTKVNQVLPEHPTRAEAVAAIRLVGK
ncbi:MAG: STAS domain-containing protein [Planctomycetia bacterium]|nr:STAS domain-containing protein [Planctomycetia bacterium]